MDTRDSAGVAEAMKERLLESGVTDSTGRRFQLAGRFEGVVGRVCDPEPLVSTEVFLGATAPDRIVRGIGALAMLSNARRLILAVSAEEPRVAALLRREARATRLEVVEVPAVSPLDDISLVCDLAQLEGKSLRGAGLDPSATLVVDAVVLHDIAVALEGRFPLRRTVSVAGCLRQPGVVQVPLGTSMFDLVTACGGASTRMPLGWVALHNGPLTGTQVEWEAVVDLDTRGVVVLPHDHPLLRRAASPATDELRRVASACVSCRFCTDLCPVHLNGGGLQPHLLMRQIGAGVGLESTLTARPELALCALQCTDCGICSPACPAGLRPRQVVRLVAERLRSEGGDGAEPALVARPRGDRLGRRTGIRRLVDQLGLRGFAAGMPPATAAASVIPDRITLPPFSPSGGLRVPAVRVGDRLEIGDRVALGPAGSDEVDLRSPVSGTVAAVDPDDGVVIEAR